MADLDLIEKVNRQRELIGFDQNPERIYAQMLTVPFGPTEDGSRALIAGHQYNHLIPLSHPEPPIIGTAYENKFGDRSPSILQLDSDYYIVGKISKFKNNPDNIYYLIVLNKTTGELDYIERTPYQYVTETYGILYDNKWMDDIKVDSTVEKGSILRKSTAYDDYLNRCDGVNLRTAYICLEENTEDAIELSKTASRKLSSALLHQVVVIKNSNDVFLNLMGDNEQYKSFPDIGEKLKDGILFASRKITNKESLYMKSIENLKKVLMSDDKFTITGNCTLLDIDIYVNTPAKLAQEFYDSQLLYYYNDNVRFMNEFIDVVGPYVIKNYKLSYKLEKMYDRFLKILRGDPIMEETKFSDVLLKFYVMEENDVSPCDKIADRFGGKGVVSRVVDDALMPRTEDGELIEMILNPEGVPNRENGGQLYELDITGLSSDLLKVIKTYTETGIYETEEAYNTIVDYIKNLSTEQAEYIEMMFDDLQAIKDPHIYSDIKREFVAEIVDDDRLRINLQPIRDSLTIDDLAELHKAVPWGDDKYLMVPMIDSNGSIRYIKSRRKVTVGYKYTYRMKQYGEEKWTVTSLSSTNIKNENIRNKASSNHKALHPSTPVKIGDMEAEDLSHMGSEALVMNLMILSLSPQGRRKVEDLLTKDPYNVNITIDNNARNRSVEILNAYLKALGLRIVFDKSKRKFSPMVEKVFQHYDVPTPMVGIVDINKYEDDVKARAEEADKNNIPRDMIGIIPRTGK